MNSPLIVASGNSSLHFRSFCRLPGPGPIEDLKIYQTKKRDRLPSVTISCNSSPRVPEKPATTSSKSKKEKKKPSPSLEPEPSSKNFAEFKPILPAVLPLTPKDLAPDLPFQYWYSYSDLPPDAPKRRSKNNNATSVDTTGDASKFKTSELRGQDRSSRGGRLWQAVLSTEGPQKPHKSGVSDSPREKSRTRSLSPELTERIEKAAAREEAESEEGEEEVQLSDQDRKELIGTCHGSSRQINIGWEGWRPTYVGLVHTYWKRSRVCKIKCKGVVTLDMNAMCNQLETKTGGKVIGQKGGTVYLFRGMSYKHWRDARQHNVGRERSATRFPKKHHSASGKLGKEELNALRARGHEIPALRKLGRNGVYLTLVDDVSKAFSTNDLVRLNCQELHPRNFKTIGFALELVSLTVEELPHLQLSEALVPCELISFEREHILLQRTSGPANESRQHPTETPA